MLEQESNNGWETIAYASRFLNKAEEKYSINELERLGIVWSLERFKHYLYGQYFTVQTDHRALLSILKDKSTKAHQSRLTRWCDRLIPFHFNIEHIPGSKMGLTDYISRNPHGAAKPISMYDEDFVIAEIDAIVKTINAFRQRGRPRKFPILESHDNSKTSNTTTVVKRQRGRPRKTPLESRDDSKIKVPRAQSHKTKTKVVQKEHNYSLRRQHSNPNIENRVTRNDVIEQKVTQQAIAKPHLPNNSNNNQLLTQKQNSPEMQADKDEMQKTSPKSPGRCPLSFTTYLSPNKEENHTPPQQEEQTTSNTTLDKAIRDVFSSTLIAAMTNRDSVIREIRDCIIQNNEHRCKAVSKQIYAHWNQLSVNDGCILLDNRLTIPNALKEAVIDVLHATHPGSWGMTELANRLWWPFINRDLINKAKTCRPCSEFGKNLKSMIPKTKWSPMKPCVEPNEEIQIDFGGPKVDGQGRERYFLACIDRFSKFPSLKLYNNANAINVEHFLNKYMSIHGVPRSIRMDQARCQKGNIIRDLCNRNKIRIIFAPANDHRSIALVERLIQTVKRRLGCIKLDPKQHPFNIKQSLKQIAQELRICRKKATNISPFEAHFGRPANTPITNLTTKPDSRNLKWPNVQHDYLDDNIMRADEVISDERWEQEDLDSDEEVRTSKERMLTAAKNDTGEIPRTFRMTTQSTLQPIAESSKGLQLARKTIASTRSKKQLQGLYEAIPKGAALVKTSGSTLTIKYPGQDDTVLHKSEVARFGTSTQP